MDTKRRTTSGFQFHRTYPLILKPLGLTTHRGISDAFAHSSADHRPAMQTNRISDPGHRYWAPDKWRLSHADCLRGRAPDDCGHRN